MQVREIIVNGNALPVGIEPALRRSPVVARASHDWFTGIGKVEVRPGLGPVDGPSVAIRAGKILGKLLAGFWAGGPTVGDLELSVLAAEQSAANAMIEFLGHKYDAELSRALARFLSAVWRDAPPARAFRAFARALGCAVDIGADFLARVELLTSDAGAGPVDALEWWWMKHLGGMNPGFLVAPGDCVVRWRPGAMAPDLAVSIEGGVLCPGAGGTRYSPGGLVPVHLVPSTEV